jgi:enoyl-CoA hydratase/carnithine racemase
VSAPEPSSGFLNVGEDRGVVYLQVPRPAQIGKGAERLAWQIVDACTDIQQRDTPVTAVALMGGGDAFCVQPPQSADDCDASPALWREATATLAAGAAPTIAVLAGDAVGPAFELALACDLRIAAENIRLGAPEIRWGRIPAAGGTQRLARSVGRGIALRMLLLGEILNAQEAMDIGLIHRTASSDAIQDCLEELLDRLRAAAPIALAYTKEAVRDGSDLPLRSGLALEADLAALLQTTRDRAEGIRAFKEHDTPRFEGR